MRAAEQLPCPGRHCRPHPALLHPSGASPATVLSTPAYSGGLYSQSCTGAACPPSVRANSEMFWNFVSHSGNTGTVNNELCEHNHSIWCIKNKNHFLIIILHSLLSVPGVLPNCTEGRRDVMLAPGRPLSAVQAVMSRWQLETGHGGSVRALKTRKHYKSGRVGGSLGAFTRQKPHSRFSRGSCLCKRVIVTCKDNHRGDEGALPEGCSCWVQTVGEGVVPPGWQTFPGLGRPGGSGLAGQTVGHPWECSGRLRGGEVTEGAARPQAGSGGGCWCLC